MQPGSSWRDQADLELFLVQARRHLTNAVHLHVDDAMEDLEHALRDDLKYLAHIRNELAAVVLRDRDEIGTVGLTDSHEGDVQRRGQLEKRRAQLDDQGRIVLDSLLYTRLERISNIRHARGEHGAAQVAEPEASWSN